jgi:hypothetical protein
VHSSVSRFLTTAAAVAIVGLATAPQAQAVPFTVTSQLTGDFRAGNPDNLVVDVTITGDTTSNQVQFLVDLNMTATHPNARLGVFAFNVASEWHQYVTFSNFSPSSWSMTIGNNVPGSGGADFRFESNDPPGNSNNVTNSQSLTFTARLNSIFGGTQTWSAADFTGAALSTGGGIPNPGAQLGAHIQSLSTAGCSGCSTSGFASGNYSSGIPTSPVPEPTTLLFMGMGLLATAVRRRARQ